jgi:hypothetical protein
MKYGRMRGNKREVTIGMAHTVTVNSLIESNKQTNKARIMCPGLMVRVTIREAPAPRLATGTYALGACSSRT